MPFFGEKEAMAIQTETGKEYQGRKKKKMTKDIFVCWAEGGIQFGQH